MQTESHYRTVDCNCDKIYDKKENKFTEWCLFDSKSKIFIPEETVYNAGCVRDTFRQHQEFRKIRHSTGKQPVQTPINCCIKSPTKPNLTTWWIQTGKSIHKSASLGKVLTNHGREVGNARFVIHISIPMQSYSVLKEVSIAPGERKTGKATSKLSALGGG